jgi:hypothetical protein
MKPHPAFVGREIPHAVELGPFRLHWLTPSDLDEDYAAVTESEAELLSRFRREWPRGLTKEANALDLAWHQREFEASRSFAWVIDDRMTGAYLGCAYVDLGWSADGPLEPWWWFRTSVANRQDLASFRGLFLDWLSGAPWPKLPIVAARDL